MTGIKRTDPARDWTEDFAHENGRYQSRCYRCGEHFQGYKRRVVCRLCDSAVSAPIDPAPEAGAVVPVAWVIPGDDTARGNGAIDAMAWKEGEFTRPLYASPPPPPVSAEVIGKLVDALRMARLYIVDDVKRKPSEYDPSVDLKRIDAVLALVGEVR